MKLKSRIICIFLLFLMSGFSLADDRTPDPTSLPTPGSTAEPVETVKPIVEMYGDVNTDNKIDIIDALLIAQYYVGMDLDNFNPDVANVNGDDYINIIDALLVAQYYVGIPLV